MKTNLMMDFSVDKQNNTITVKREFDAKLPRVWNAYTNSDILDQWWAPEPWKARTKSFEFANGGQWHYAMVGPEGEEHWAIATYNDIVSEKQFSARDAFADADGNINPEMPQSEWNVRFTEKSELTLVENRIVFQDLEQLEQILAMGFREGLTMASEGLDRLLAETK